jgi:hypothetical protein
MYIVNKLAKAMTVDDQEYEEIIEEYEEEILIPEGVPEPPVTDTAFDTAPAQGKPRCIILIFNDHYICVMHLRCRKLYENHMQYISTYKSY